MYFTSWDANVFLCLLSVFPEEVVRRMIKMVKKTHEDFVRMESMDYHCNLARHLLYKNNMYFPPLAIQQLKEKWIWRCPEKRRDSIVRWTRIDWDRRCSPVWEKDPFVNPGKGTSRAGYWNSCEAWSYSILDRNLDTSEWSDDEEEEYYKMKDEKRKEYVSQWYENIHEGRYFLFFKENDILDPKVYDNYRNEERSIMSIWDLGDRRQTAQDLLTLDGGGLGQKPGNHIQHIDDLFL